MSGLELAASTVAIIEISTKIAGACGNYVRDVWAAKPQARALEQMAILLSSDLRRAHPLIEGQIEGLLSEAEALRNSFKACIRELEVISQKLGLEESGRPQSRKSVWWQIRRPFLAMALSQKIKALEDCRNSIAYNLQLDLSYAHGSLQFRCRQPVS